MSVFNTAISIDGLFDSIRLSRLHIWPFNLTPNQMSIYNDGKTTGVLSGGADDLQISNSLFFNLNSAVNLFQGSSGTTFANISNTDFDNYGGLVVSAGIISKYKQPVIERA
ncbi:hypothetical protein [Glaciimonas soli]|uniref:Uncharacterized protein n=1 Tax=Glaciimonas soli TaxID=2590999 RepID=A0A843YU82_9BURK|nr:hypothetical protein [Glaciimonas soli]MQR01264.1 hypothetical protein [Glaciimonas soli]